MLNKYKLRLWSVLIRSIGKCDICEHSGPLDAHHLRDKSTYPELAYHLDNGVPLCNSTKDGGNDCHGLFHFLFMGGSNISCTEKDYLRFKKLIGVAKSMDAKRLRSIFSEVEKLKY